MKTCRECGEPIPASRATQARYCSDFCKKKGDRTRRADTIREEHRSWTQRNREHILNKRREWRESNRDHTRTYARDWARRQAYGPDAEWIFANPENQMRYSRDRFKHARAQGFRSGLEVAVAKQLDEAGVDYQYELFTLKYLIPERLATYKPDFILPNGLVIELKGEFTSKDRQKHKFIKEQHPDLDVRIVFSNPRSKIGKKSATTYAMWCERLNIPYAAKSIPDEWINEPANPKAVAAARRVLGWEPATKR